MTKDDTISNIDSDNEENENIKDIVENEPLYYVLGQFLESANSGKNIATIMEELTLELKQIRLQQEKLLQVVSKKSVQE